MDRRTMVSSLVGGTTALRPTALTTLERGLRTVEGATPDEVAQDEPFWLAVRQAFTIDPNHVNLNSGSVSPAPRAVAEAMDRYWTITNMSPSLYVDDLLYPQVELVRRRLAATFGCDPEELALTRNTSESLLSVQFGLPLDRGDEIVTTTQDYPRMLTGWDQRARRDGVIVRRVSFPVPPPSLDDLYQRIVAAVTPRTRVIHICHMTYTAGQIFPVKRICQFARTRGITSIVDGGHTFAQFPFTRDDLDCDVYATSLHKWLTAPVGNGFLYVKKDRIREIWPLYAAPPEQDGDIRKFEQIGTYPIALRNAVSEALTFHTAIGFDRKAARFNYLRERWMRAVEPVKGVRLLTSFDRAQACALGGMSLASMNAAPLVEYLVKKHLIHVRARFVPGEWEGIRVTPNVFTTLEEIDLFSRAIREAA
ncbi:MAG: aminotransferase class V-fold PLP-dependent enzyme [Gemmatimonadales bacterium]